jgi:hypothetical protein
MYARAQWNLKDRWTFDCKVLSYKLLEIGEFAAWVTSFLDHTQYKETMLLFHSNKHRLRIIYSLILHFLNFARSKDKIKSYSSVQFSSEFSIFCVVYINIKLKYTELKFYLKVEVFWVVTPCIGIGGKYKRVVESGSQ